MSRTHRVQKLLVVINVMRPLFSIKTTICWKNILVLVSPPVTHFTLLFLSSTYFTHVGSASTIPTKHSKPFLLELTLFQKELLRLPNCYSDHTIPNILSTFRTFISNVSILIPSNTETP